MTQAQWQAWVKGLGATATVWPFQWEPDGVTLDSHYGNAAARFTSDQYTGLAGTTTTDPTGQVTFTFPATVPTDGVGTNAADTLVYVAASTMTGDLSVDQSGAAQAAGVVAANTVGEQGSCPPLSTFGIPCDIAAQLGTGAKYVGLGLLGWFLLDRVL